MSTPDKKKRSITLSVLFFFIVIAAEMLQRFRWTGSMISSLVWHMENSRQNNVYIHAHTIPLPPKGKKIMSLYCCWTIVILIDSYMTFETRCVEAHCLLTGTSQRQLLNVTLRDVWNDANCWPTHWSDRLLVYPCIYRSTNDFIVLWLRMWFLFSSVL